MPPPLPISTLCDQFPRWSQVEDVWGSENQNYLSNISFDTRCPLRPFFYIQGLQLSIELRNMSKWFYSHSTIKHAFGGQAILMVGFTRGLVFSRQAFFCFLLFFSLGLPKASILDTLNTVVKERAYIADTNYNPSLKAKDLWRDVIICGCVGSSKCSKFVGC